MTDRELLGPPLSRAEAEELNACIEDVVDQMIRIRDAGGGVDDTLVTEHRRLMAEFSRARYRE